MYPLRVTDIYHPRHSGQLGHGIPVPGRSRGSRDCGPKVIQFGIDQLTRGQLRPTIVEIRERMGKEGPVTTNTTDAERCVESYDNEMSRIDRRPLKYDRYRGGAFRRHLVDALKAGDFVQIAIDYGTFNRRLGFRTGDPNFVGSPGRPAGHSVGGHGWRDRDTREPEMFLFDPLDDGRRAGIPDGPRWVPLSAVLAAWRDLGGYFGILRGGERTL